jgi:THAP4-like, heme-binding beta-barrel domain
MATPYQLHEDRAELAFLLGDWSGVGEGVWPPGERFDYAEDVTFEFVGDPFLLYAQRSWSLDDGSPIHFERGFLRPAGPGIVELLLAHRSGSPRSRSGPWTRA